MTKIMPHGPQQAHCLFALACASQITGISYDTLYKRYHRGALKAKKYGGILFINYKELTKLILVKAEEEESKEILKRDSSINYKVTFNKRKVN